MAPSINFERGEFVESGIFSKESNNGQRAWLWLCWGFGGRVRARVSRACHEHARSDICWHLLLGLGQAAGFRAPARASYQACVKPPGSLVSLKLAPECVEPVWPYTFWSRPSGAAFMRTLWIVNLLRGHEPVFDMASALNTSTTGETNYATGVFFFLHDPYAQIRAKLIMAPILAVWIWFISGK